jgi:hypothetical protein
MDTNKQYINAWDMIYAFMDNVKQTMIYYMQYEDDNSISKEDIAYILKYINNGLNDILQTTIKE